MLFSRVDGNSHKWIDAANRGKRDELIRKKKSRRNHSAPPFYQGKYKFFAMSESTRKAAGNHSIKTVHEVPFMPETIAVSRLHHSAEAITWELPQQSSHQCDQSSTPSCGDGFFCDERPSVKRELVNIWNSKLQAQGECTCTRDGELKEGKPFLLKRRICTHKNSKFLRLWDKMEGLPEITNSAGTENLNNQYIVLSVTSGVLHFVGDSLVPDTIDKTARRVPKFSNRLTRSLFRLWRAQHLI